MVTKRGTKRFGGEVFYLVERELTKTAAQVEAKRIRKTGMKARITRQSGKGLSVVGKFAVWARKR